MAFANGRIPAKNLAALPLAFSNKREQEHLTKNAYASLVRMMLRAVADTGSYFSVWDAYRSMDEQVAMLKRNYTRVSRGRYKSSDRSYGGSTWAKKPGRPLTASPGYSNHGNGLAVDIHPAAIQSWLKSNAGRFGWVNDVPSEPWHWSYLNPGRDRYRGEGLPNVKAMQAKLGIEQDGKPGPDFVKHVKKFQKANGLEVDGKAGPSTVKAILSGKGDGAPVVVAPAPDPAKSPDETVIELPALPKVERGKTSPNANMDRKGHSIKHVTVHWWGEPSGQSFDGIVNWLCDPKAQVSAHYVISATRVAQIVHEDHRSWANGNSVANSESITIECDPNDVLGTLPVLAALIADIRSRHGDLPIYPHQHWTPTECPGEYLPHLDAVDDLARTGKTVINTPTKPAPSTGGDMPEGKELLMKLQDIPDFPLLRTPGNLCYYGDDEKQTSVTGKMPNSLVPGEIFGSGKSSGARGLKCWQAKAGIEADGRFGAGTKAKVKEVQRKAGLKQDGALGPLTWYALWLVG